MALMANGKTLKMRSEIILDADCEWLREIPIHSRNGMPTIRIRNQGKGQHCPLSHLILNKKDGFVIDHINGNQLDNRVENLRYATKAQNGFNCKKKKNSTNKYKGIRSTSNGKFCALIRGKYLGIFLTEEEAYQAYLEKARQIYGEEFVSKSEN